MPMGILNGRIESTDQPVACGTLALAPSPPPEADGREESSGLRGGVYRVLVSASAGDDALRVDGRELSAR